MCGKEFDTHISFVTNIFNDDVAVFGLESDPKDAAACELWEKHAAAYTAHEENTRKIRLAYSRGQLSECERLCLEDIQLAPGLRDYHTEHASIYGWAVQLPVYHTFARLAILYEKQGQYQDAADVCQQAIKLGFVKDGAKGMEHRLSRLLRKLGQ